MADPIAELERGREAYARRAWLQAYESLSGADRRAPLAAEELELLATASYMLGRDEDHRSALERAHQARLEAGEALPAVRCAFWMGMNLLLRGDTAQATGWFARAERLLDREKRDCVERGYLLIPVLLRALDGGDWDAGRATAADAVAVAERFGDPDLLALAGHEQGHALIRQGRLEEGLRLLDEAMVAAIAGELSPIVTGLVYCSVIGYCQDLYELRRAREWTDALTRWCEEQPDMVAHTGVCLVHRAEIMELQGAWGAALEEARRARERCARGTVNRLAVGQAIYRQGEVHRLRGELVQAEETYREANGHGYEPQPGLALLRLARGDGAAAVAAIRRVLTETPDPLRRARLLSAGVEIMLAVGHVEDARGSCRELEEISAGHGGAVLGTMSAAARGAVDLAAGDSRGALTALQHARQGWLELEVPYEAARVRVLIGLACRALGDHDTATMEFEAAGRAFAQLGAAPELKRLDSLNRRAAAGDAHGLTSREMEVLRLVAAGRSNREIAEALVISEHTVARHLQNIFMKLRVSSRTAATGFAFEHDLV
jgi:DNA-binding CsgD family transcriptional regulator